MALERVEAYDAEKQRDVDESGDGTVIEHGRDQSVDDDESLDEGENED